MRAADIGDTWDMAARPGPPSRILIVKLSSLGDIVHAWPVACSLRASFPQARLGWVVERKWLPLIAHHPDVDEVFTVDSLGLRGRPHRWNELLREVREVRRFGASAALDLQGTLKSAFITRASGAPSRIGFTGTVRREPGAGMAYNVRVEPHVGHVVEQMLDLAETLGPLQRQARFPFPIPAPATAGVERWIEENRIGEFAFFSPGGGWASKRWPSERYAALAEILERRHGLTAVLNRGPGEQNMDDAYRRANQIRARLFSGDVEHLGAILKRARVVVGGDTGPLQLAAALDVPTVALFGPTDPARNGPYSPRSHSIVLRKTTETTYQRRSSYSPAMMAISPEEVAEACGRLLAESAGSTDAAPPRSAGSRA
ncbi:MAG: glycosyltransferase family 9 protein [Terriglobales bacterium]